MKRLWLILAVLGFFAPLYWLLKVTVETGNILFWTDPAATNAASFVNDYTTAFLVDLFYVVITFFIFTAIDAKKSGVKNVWLIWVLTLLFGMAGPFPLYLYLREKAREQSV